VSLRHRPTQLDQTAKPQGLILSGGVDKTSGRARNCTTIREACLICSLSYQWFPDDRSDSQQKSLLKRKKRNRLLGGNELGENERKSKKNREK